MNPPKFTDDAPQPRRPNRPLAIKLIMWAFALWILLGWLRFGWALGEAELIIGLVGTGVYVYLVLAGLAWGLLGLPILWGLLRREAWAPTLLVAGAVLYPALYWIERLLLWQDPAAHRNWPFMLFLTVAWFGVVAWGLLAGRRAYFSDTSRIR
jgi:hypothetical protein